MDGNMTEVIRQFSSPPPCPSCLGEHMESRGWQQWPWRLRQSCRHWSWLAAPSDCHWSPHSHSARCRRLLPERSRLSPRCQDRTERWQDKQHLRSLCLHIGAGRRHWTVFWPVFTLRETLSNLEENSIKSEDTGNVKTNTIIAYNFQITLHSNVCKTTV